jgi:vancomycin resistance protein YoaR
MIYSWFLGLLLMIYPYQDIPISIKDNNETIAVISREDVLLRVPGLEVIDPVRYGELLNQIEQQIEKKPENATISDSGTIIQEKVGYKLNRKAFTKQFFQHFYDSDTTADLEVPKTRYYPKVDSELLSMIRTKRIGQYITYYNAYKKSRANNISLATKAINNKVLFPGEVFSFNKIVGIRTENRGYMKAPEIVKGELIEGIGGGICQVSSTLYNAVDHSGLTIIERYSHSKHVPYVPPGRDATVSWYGPDFTFRNDYNQPILIRAQARNGRMVVFIYSSEDINYEPRNVQSNT